MMILTGSQDESTIFVLEDGSEVEITVIELERNKSRIMVCTDDQVSVIHEILTKEDSM